ncbi:hypothetical protein O181_100350 [Austropuccinia psidii MF-1]|uniref:Integrase zinc-binding domain-containing protein n=1 Tax=Austropuccinia psidii MF-1 TaxID=1389203 RepID=A0A9Q3JFG5_9BASI|nr:hypothetical protein [Austropuccinia psidii MF-1]
MIPIHFMEIDRRNNFRLSQWAPGSGTPDSGDIDSEETETPIIGISSSELHNVFLSAVLKTYAKHKQCGIVLQLLKQKYRSPELETQLEELWLRHYKDSKFLLINGLFYHRERHTTALIVVDRDHISLILQECHNCPYMGHMSEDRTKERVESTAWCPKWEQELSEYINTCEICQKENRKHGKKYGYFSKNAVEVKLTEEFFRKPPVFPVSLVKAYFQKEEDKFPSRKKNPTPPEIVGVENCPSPLKKIIKARKAGLNGKDQRKYLVRFKHQTADTEKWVAEDAIPDGNLHLGRFRASRSNEQSRQ